MDEIESNTLHWAGGCFSISQIAAALGSYQPASQPFGNASEAILQAFPSASRFRGTRLLYAIKLRLGAFNDVSL